MDVGMRFALLGPMELTSTTGDRVPVSGPRQRILLAALLLSANVPVSIDVLAEAVWNGSPPPGAGSTLRSHIRRLRQTLGPGAGARITARAPGYLICVRPPMLDVLTFEALCREASTARHAARWTEVEAATTRALELWRGIPLLDVPSQILRDQALPQLEQMRLQALEDHAEADLRLHQHARLISELRDLTAQYPLRERFHAQLIEALARDGRQAEALDAYQQARQELVDKLGIEPGPELQILQRKILTGDPALITPPPRDERPPEAVIRSPAAAVVPRQLPAAARYFTGRDAELAELTALLGTVRANDAGVVVVAVDGAPGVGKTALAVRWAQQVAAEFPDGQLYVNLHGFDPSSEITDAGTAIRGFLDAFAIPAERVPSSPESQAALYRTVLAGKRVLIVADNARDAGQVRPLLPGSPGCLVVVTSRARLTGLAAAEGGRLLTLDVLSAGEAHKLLARRIGVNRVRAEPDAVDGLALLCGRLPLALTVAAARAAARPAMSLAALATELASAAGRLQALETGDPATDVRMVFSWSYQQLDQLPARTFRLLGLHPGPDITVPATAALVDTTEANARAALGTLAMANLVDEHIPGRFAVHDLLRDYAAERAAEQEPQNERDVAIHRALDFYLHTSHAAAMLLDPSRDAVILPPPRPGVTPERLTSSQQALAWFEAEHRILISAISIADQQGADACAWQLPWAMDRFLNWRGHWQEWATAHRTALAAATRIGDKAGQAKMRGLLSERLARAGDYLQARVHLTHCLSLYRQLGNRAGEGRVHQGLGWIAERQDRYADALDHAQQALVLYQEAGDQARQAAALNNVGWCLILTGSYRQARAVCLQALAAHRQLGHRHGEAAGWDSLGYAEHKLGNLTEAADYHHRAIDIVRELGNRYDEAEFLTHLGDVYRTAGDQTTARNSWQQALDILNDLHHKDAAQLRARLGQQYAVVRPPDAEPATAEGAGPESLPC